MDNKVEEKVKISGIYPGSITDTKLVDGYDEVNLYFAIEALGYHLFSCKHAMLRDQIPIIDLSEEEYALEYLVYQTRKYGTKIKEAQEGEHITDTVEYRAWYKFYDQHFKQLSDDEWKELTSLREQGKDISKFYPQGDWKDLLKDNEPGKRI